MKEVNKAYDRTVKGDVKYRFVIDMASFEILIRGDCNEHQTKRIATFG